MIIGSLRRVTRYASWPRIRKSLKGVPWFPLVIMVLFVVVGVFGRQLAPHDPLKIDIEIRLLPLFFMKGGSLQYPLGTDHLGRDVLPIPNQPGRPHLRFVRHLPTHY